MRAWALAFAFVTWSRTWRYCSFVPGTSPNWRKNSSSLRRWSWWLLRDLLGFWERWTIWGTLRSLVLWIFARKLLRSISENISFAFFFWCSSAPKKFGASDLLLTFGSISQRGIFFIFFRAMMIFHFILAQVSVRERGRHLCRSIDKISSLYSSRREYSG